MPAPISRSPVAVVGAVLLTLGAAHIADRIAFGVQMKALGLAPAQPIVSVFP